MREKVLFDSGWLFHRGDIEVPLPRVKGPVYMQAKTESKKQGPASVFYNDAENDYRNNVEYTADKWEKVSLPHD